MKYMLLVHHDEEAFSKISKEKRQQMLAESVELTHQLHANGQYLSASPLHPAATAVAQPLSTWTVWTACRLVAFTYGMFILHDLVFLVVTGADVLGRLSMAGLIVRARRLERPPPVAAPDGDGHKKAPAQPAR